MGLIAAAGCCCCSHRLWSRAWRGRSSARRRRGSSTAPSNEAGLNWRADFYSLPDLIVMLGIYYNPYVYMFTGSALCNMEPSLEQAAESSGASAFSSLFTVMFPLIMPAIVSGTLLCFIVRLGI
jgi:ABC-type Fe3+ transport system permease subunit